MSQLSFMAHAIQQGVIRRILAGLLLRTLHNVVFDRDPETGIRWFRVWEGPPTEGLKPIFEYAIPEQKRGESNAMWDVRISTELPALWNASQAAKIALAKANCPPPPAPDPNAPVVLTDAEAREAIAYYEKKLHEAASVSRKPEVGIPSQVDERQEPEPAGLVKARGRKKARPSRVLQDSRKAAHRPVPVADA